MKRKINNKYKEFTDLLEFSRGKYNPIDIFRDLVVIFAIAIKNSIDYSQEDEDTYLQIIKKYEKSESEIFVKLSTKLILMYSEEYEIKDVLGEIFETIGANSKVRSQFFTPMHIAEMMSETILAEDEIKNNKFISIKDPACGSGVLLLGVADYLNTNEIDYKNKIFVEAQDIDFTCFCMTYIQLSLYAIPGRVILGNSLLNERRKIFYTPEFFIGRWKEKIEERMKNSQ